MAIDQGWFSTGELENMKSTYSYFIRKQSNAYYKLVRTFKSDTLMVNAFDSLTILYQEYPSLRSKYELAFEYAELEDSPNASATLGAILEEYDLDTEESEFHQEVEEFLSVLYDYLTNDGYNDLDSTQLETLISLSQSAGGQIKALARNVILAYNYSNYNEPFIFPQQTLKSDRIKRLPIKLNALMPSMLVYPNPASNIIQIEIINVDYDSYGELSVFDLTGRLIHSRKVSKWQKSFIISTEDLKQGAYLLLYKDITGYTQSRKLIISD